MPQILVGCDPELFVVRDGELVSGYNLIPGTKQQPYKVPQGAVQVDGMALEFNIDPASSAREFFSNVNTVLEEMRRMVPGFNLLAEPAVVFSDQIMQAMPPEAKELGCDPDFNAWLMGEPNPRPDASSNMRTGSGHIHVGWTDGEDPWQGEHIYNAIDVTRQLDYFLGVPSLLWDPDSRRRELYGKAGAFRPKPYGVEYRVLSNRWLASNELIEWVYNATVAGVTRFFDGDNLFDEFDDLAQNIINNGDTGSIPDNYFQRLGIEPPPVGKAA